MGLCSVESSRYIGPINDVPERRNVVRLDVLVIEVEGVLPHVKEQQRDAGSRQISLVVVELFDDQLLAQAVPGQDCPAAALNAERRGREVRLKPS